MDAMLHRRCAKYIYVVPDGLRELMTDISREVLRSQPANMYTYIADYLDALMITRENARIAAKVIQGITETAEMIVAFLETSGMDRGEAEEVSAFIQQAIQDYLDQEEKNEIMHYEQESEGDAIKRIISEAGIDEERATEAETIVQEAFDNFRDRKNKERQLLSGVVDWRVAARSAIKLYRKTGVSNEEAHRAATLIKAAYKGYYTRRTIKRLADEQARDQYSIEEEEEEEEEEDEEDDEDEEDEDSGEDFLQLGQKGSKHKAVRINYDTVIPHVEFQEPVVIDDHADSVVHVRAELDSRHRSEAETEAREVLEDIFGAVTGRPKSESSASQAATKRAMEQVKSAKEKVAEEKTGSLEFIREMVLEEVLGPVLGGAKLTEVHEKPFVKEHVEPLGEEDTASIQPKEGEEATGGGKGGAT